jgi:hypothetical protein
MNPTPDSASADLQQTIADLQHQLAEARAERDVRPGVFRIRDQTVDRPPLNLVRWP